MGYNPNRHGKGTPDGGKFAPGDAGRASAGQLDFDSAPAMPDHAIDLDQVNLVYTDEHGEQHRQPLSDVEEMGTLIDPESGDDMDFVGVEVNGAEVEGGQFHAIYHDEHGEQHRQPVGDIPHVGTLIDPETGEDMEMDWVEPADSGTGVQVEKRTMATTASSSRTTADGMQIDVQRHYFRFDGAVRTSVQYTTPEGRIGWTNVGDREYFPNNVDHEADFNEAIERHGGWEGIEQVAREQRAADDARAKEFHEKTGDNTTAADVGVTEHVAPVLYEDITFLEGDDMSPVSGGERERGMGSILQAKDDDGNTYTVTQQYAVSQDEYGQWWQVHRSEQHIVTPDGGEYREELSVGNVSNVTFSSEDEAWENLQSAKSDLGYQSAKEQGAFHLPSGFEDDDFGDDAFW